MADTQVMLRFYQNRSIAMMTAVIYRAIKTKLKQLYRAAG